MTHRRLACLRRAIACVLLVHLPLVAAFAAEGFFADKQPPAVRAAWNSVFAFVCEGGGSRYVASAFLVKKTSRGKNADYYFITAGHAVEDCRQPRRYLVADINHPRYESDGITLAAALPRLSGIAPVSVDEAYDIALIRASAPAKLVTGPPLPAGEGCARAMHRKLYAIGIPGVAQRRSLRKLPEVKRWSSGEAVGLGRAEFRGTEKIYIASTVDSLPGSSGGPVIDDGGKLVGVVAKGAAAPENGYRYDVDPSKRDDWQTFLVPCEAVSQIMQDSGLNSTD